MMRSVGEERKGCKGPRERKKSSIGREEKQELRRRKTRAPSERIEEKTRTPSEKNSIGEE